jgi:hypothetical protein
MTVPPLFGIRIKDDSKVLMVGTNTDVGDSTLIQLEITVALTSIVPSASATLEDVGLDGRVEVVDVIKAMVMEE